MHAARIDLHNSNIGGNAGTTMQSPLPTYSIYGEHGRTMDVDWLHCESIAERSSLQDWEIGPHKHELLFQLFWIEKGRCTVSLDGSEQAVKGPCLLLAPPQIVHGFHFEPRLQGHVVTVLAQHLSKLLAEEPALASRLMKPRVQPLDAGQNSMVALAIRALREEFHSAADWRSLGVDSALIRLLVTLGRCLPALPTGTSPHGSRGLQHVRRYRALIEERFRLQPALASLADEIGITSTQLNRVCQAALGCA